MVSYCSSRKAHKHQTILLHLFSSKTWLQNHARKTIPLERFVMVEETVCRKADITGPESSSSERQSVVHPLRSFPLNANVSSLCISSCEWVAWKMADLTCPRLCCSVYGSLCLAINHFFSSLQLFQESFIIWLFFLSNLSTVFLPDSSESVIPWVTSQYSCQPTHFS